MRMGGKLHAPADLPPGKRPGTHCIGGLVSYLFLITESIFRNEWNSSSSIRVYTPINTKMLCTREITQLNSCQYGILSTDIIEILTDNLEN
jgi:hypothetical protein